MYIKKLTLNNFKSFVGENTINFRPGINYLVGNNNVGKTTIFDAIQFLLSGEIKGKCLKSQQCKNDEYSVKIVLAEVGELDESNKKYDSYIHNNELTLMRSSKKETIKQNDKDITLDIKKIRIMKWNTDKPIQFENPTGIANTISSLFNPQFIYASSSNEEYVDFGTTKIAGKLIGSLTSDFMKSDIYSEFLKAHARAFGEEGILTYLDEVQKNIASKLSEQFGPAKFKFSFEQPPVTDFLKKGDMELEEDGVWTNAGEKGNGMQRALALAIVQVVAEVNSSLNGMQFFIDEPEIYLHPIAQDKLMGALKKLVPSNQVFITTHSPYILRNFDSKSDSVSILQKNEQPRIKKMQDLFFTPPDMDEVTYKAFGVPTIGLHQKLFTSIYIRKCEDNSNLSLSQFDDILSSEFKIEKNFSFVPRYKGDWGSEQMHTLSYVIRNEIDHPEVCDEGKNKLYDDEMLLLSIKQLFQVMKNL